MPDVTISIWTAAVGFFLGFLAYFFKKWCPSLYVHILTAILGIGWIVYVFLDQGFIKTVPIFFIFGSVDEHFS
ncbi:hypothetical protein ABEV46_15355, partial [Geobacillus stearothermophilus]